MENATHWVAIPAGWLQMADVPFASWIPVLGLVLGVSLFLVWQRRTASIWGTPAEVSAVPTYRRTLPRLSMELARMRRYERTLAVMVLQLEGQVAGKRGEGRDPSGQGALAYWHVAAMLRELLRNSDIVTMDPAEARFVVVLPEANRNQALQTANRLQTPVAATTQMRLRLGVAEFPGDGLIIEELVKAAALECATSDKDPAGLVAQLES